MGPVHKVTESTPTIRVMGKVQMSACSCRSTAYMPTCEQHSEVFTLPKSVGRKMKGGGVGVGETLHVQCKCSANIPKYENRIAVEQ